MNYDTIEFASYADNVNPYTFQKSFDEIIEKLEIDTPKIYESFIITVLKANP